MANVPKGESEDVVHYTASDERLIAILLRSSFSDYEHYPPTMETQEEHEYLDDLYDVEEVEKEKYTKAEISGYDVPLHVLLLNRPEGSYTKPHYHEANEPPTSDTRHQIFVCQRGKAEIGVYTKEGEKLGAPVLEAGDLILLAEGHSVEFLEPDTKLIEIRQGPVPTKLSDRVVFIENPDDQ